jgi:GrpB-like predicted nucleotidyltransferase (UPF0157 family)
MRIGLAPHDPAWAAAFRDVGAELRRVFGSGARRIDHIGSTAMPGLAAKPIIDVQVSVSSLAIIASVEHPLASVDYVVMDNDDRRKRYARRRNPGQDANVHVRVDGEFSQQAVLLFRDYVRATPHARNRYEQRKRRLSQRDWSDVDEYAAAKVAWVWQLLSEADRWSWAGWTLGPSGA